MTAVEVRSMTQPPYAPVSTGRLPCVPCRRPWGIVAERLHAIACRALGSATCAPAPTPSDQRQGQALHPHDALRMGPCVRSTATATSAPPPLTAGSGTTTVSEDTQPSATSPRSLVLTREAPTFSGLTPRSQRLRLRGGKVCGPGHTGRQQAKQWSAGDSTTPADPTRSN